MKNKIFRRELFNAIMVLLFGVLMIIYTMPFTMNWPMCIF